MSTAIDPWFRCLDAAASTWSNRSEPRIRSHKDLDPASLTPASTSPEISAGLRSRHGRNCGEGVRGLWRTRYDGHLPDQSQRLPAA